MSRTGNQRSSSTRQKPFVTTKLRPPSNKAKLVQRERLMDILGQTLAHKLVLIHGSAGFGKTTLAAQWYGQLAANGVVVAWLNIDASDNDLGGFLTYVIEAIRSAEPEIGSGLSEIMESNPGQTADFVFGNLVNELELYDREFVLFLEDWHLIQDPAIHQALDFLLFRSPPSFHIVITSRNRIGIPVAKLRVQNELVEINGMDLRFDYEESRTFLAEAKELDLDAEALKTLWLGTEGWVAALQLASISLRRAGDKERILHWASGMPSDIGEYLAENVLASLPKDLLDFMLKTSMLGRLSADLCCAVTGEKASAHFLDMLERQELFLLPLDEERTWFRYHHLFAKFLQQRLKRDAPGTINQHHLAASQWFSAHGQTAEALTHALAAGEPVRAIEVVEKDAMSLMQRSYMGSLLGLVSQLPRALLFDHAVLQTAVAWAYVLTHHPQEAEEALHHVTQIALKSESEIGKLLLGEANVIRASIAVYADQVADGVEATVRPCLDESSKYPPWVVGVGANVLTYLYIHTCRFEKVAPLQSWARQYQDRAEGLFSGVYGRCFSGMAACAVGDLSLGRKHFLDALQLARNSAGELSHAARLAGAMLGQLKYEMNELQEAECLLQDSRILGNEGGVVDFYIATFVSSSRLMIQRGNQSEATAILQEGAETARYLHLPRLAAAVACEQVRLNLMLGDVRAAEQILVDFDMLRSDASPPQNAQGQTWDYLQVAWARLLCEQGHGEQGIGILQAQSKRAREAGRKSHEIGVNVLLSIALSLAGRTAEAEELLARTITESLPLGFIRSFLDEGPRVVTLLERLREKSRRHQISTGTLPEFGAYANQLLATSRSPDRGLPALHGSKSSTAGSDGSAKQKLPFDDLLKSREIEILRLLDQGRSNKEIARAIGISVETVKWYLKTIFSKLGVARRGQAIIEARRLRLLDEL